MFVQEDIFPADSTGSSCHGATIACLPDGRLIAAWYAGAYETAPDQAILMSWWAPDGSWTLPSVVVDTPGHADGNPVLWVDEQGVLWLFYVTIQGWGWRSCQIFYRRSLDGGATWQSPVILHGEWGWMTRHKPLALCSGRVLLPLYDEVHMHSFMLLSDDDGQTWHAGEPIETEPGNLQPTVVQRQDGSLFCLMRPWTAGDVPYLRLSLAGLPPPPQAGPGHLWQAVSRDEGETWEQVGMGPFPNPNAGADMVRLVNGHLVLAFNNSTIARTPLDIALSEDEGRTWGAVAHLETGDGEYSYPAVIQTPDGLIHVAYTWRRQTIRHVVLDEDWIRTAIG